jgi:hypothetical protein
LSILALFSILASGAYALAVDPCLVCRDGATAGDDFAPFATDGLNASCADLIEEIKVIESESEACLGGSFEDVRSMCCPGTPLEDPCIVCSGGITAGDDFAPFAKFDGDPTTCKQFVNDSAAIGAGSESCAEAQDEIEPFCCPTTPENPCIICSDGVTAGEDFVPFANDGENITCNEYIDYFKLIEKGSATCDWSQQVEGYCCPTTLENPCIACPNGITAGDDFMPYAEVGYLMPCKVIIEEYKFFDAENPECAWKDWEEAPCCPTTPENPCNICPDGLTAADDRFPYNDGQTCKQNIDTAKLIEVESEACTEWGPGYKVGCCPNVTLITSTVEETITAATTIATTSTTDATTSTASTSLDATSTSATSDSELTTTTATLVTSTEPIPSGGVTVSGFSGFSFIIGVSSMYSFAFA